MWLIARLFENDQAADMLGRQRQRALNRFVDDILAPLHHAFGRGEQRCGAHLSERAANIALENDNDDENDRGEKIVEDPVERK